MADIKLQKRDHDFFVSYGHDDLVRVVPLVELLKRVCGLRIWFDGADGNASTRSSELLAGAIGNARGAVLCLSEAWKGSSWCKNEFEVSLAEQRKQAGFEIVAVRLDNVDPPAWFNVAEIIDLRQANAQGFARLLRSLASDVPHRYDNAEDVYLAAPWSHPSPLAAEVFQALRRTGWRLVGDAPNLKHLGARRIEAIMRTTRGVVALLPFDALRLDGSTSPYVLEEARLALNCGKQLLLLAEPGVTVPDAVARRALLGLAVQLSASPEGRAALAAVLDGFEEQLQHEAHDDTGAFIFFAASLRGDPSEADDLVSVIERSSNIELRAR